jgi:regulatory protein
MTPKSGRKPRPPLDAERLNELALRYVAKYATTRAKLSAYLGRKVRERGWEGVGEAPIDRLVARFSRTGLVDDSSYALSKSRSLSERGFGQARLCQTLRAAGVEEKDAADARQLAADTAAEAALRFARRRRIGPFATSLPDRKQRDRALAAMIRAGHGFELARLVVDCAPGAIPDAEELHFKTG